MAGLSFARDFSAEAEGFGWTPTEPNSLVGKNYYRQKHMKLQDWNGIWFDCLKNLGVQVHIGAGKLYLKKYLSK